MTMAKKESLAKNVKCFSGIKVEEVVKICLLVPPFKLLENSLHDKCILPSVQEHVFIHKNLIKYKFN